MNIELGKFKFNLPYNLHDKVYYRVPGEIRVYKGTIRRLKIEFFAKTGAPNIRVQIKAAIHGRGKVEDYDLGCFSRSEDLADSDPIPRIVRLTLKSDVSYPIAPWVHWQVRKKYKDLEWKP